MTEFSTITVEKGDSPWKFARKTLANNPGTTKVTNAQIIDEINRLIQLNDCEDIQDFGKKFFSSVGKDVIVDKKEEEYSSVPIRVKLSPAELIMKEFNAIPGDEQRIVEYNKKHYKGEYYGIIDKKHCKLRIYNKAGEIQDVVEIGVGKKRGDNLGSFYAERARKTDKAYLAETGRYTPAGEFTLDEIKETKANLESEIFRNYIKDGKIKLMDLKGDSYGEDAGDLAMHADPTNHPERVNFFYNNSLWDNRMSYGCVNLLEEDYDAMHQYLGEGDKVFILPEEEGNQLLLEEQKGGQLVFAQQYHKDQKRSKTAEEASIVKYDVRPERDPANIQKKKDLEYLAKRKAEEEEAKQKAEAEAKAAALAEAEAKKFKWTNPKTWFAQL